MIILGIFILIAVLILVSPLVRSIATGVFCLCLIGAVALAILGAAIFWETIKQNQQAPHEVAAPTPEPQTHYVSRSEFNQKVNQIFNDAVRAGRPISVEDAVQQAVDFYRQDGQEVSYN
jgi:hypothetical protein